MISRSEGQSLMPDVNTPEFETLFFPEAILDPFGATHWKGRRPKNADQPFHILKCTGRLLDRRWKLGRLGINREMACRGLSTGHSPDIWQG
jgi:hypothetical protein